MKIRADCSEVHISQLCYLQESIYNVYTYYQQVILAQVNITLWYVQLCNCSDVKTTNKAAGTGLHVQVSGICQDAYVR
jgi:hypothetical protein